MAKRTVRNVLTRPGGKPVVGKQVSVHLNTGAWTDDGTREVLRKVYATTDDTGLWSVELDINADLDPDLTHYTVSEDRGLIWPFVVEAGDGPVWLRECLQADPTNPNPIQAGVSSDALEAAIEALNLGTASTHPATDFDPAGAAAGAQAAATAAAASDATSKASAAQAAAISAAASDATTKASAAQSAATSAAATDATTKANAVAAQLGNYVAKPSGGAAVGSVPTKQADGSIAYALPAGIASNIGLDTDGIPYYSPGASGAAIAADLDGVPYFTAL